MPLFFVYILYFCKAQWSFLELRYISAVIIYYYFYLAKGHTSLNHNEYAVFCAVSRMKMPAVRE